jgi:hypothetical protein
LSPTKTLPSRDKNLEFIALGIRKRKKSTKMGIFLPLATKKVKIWLFF